jgi:hypothetical protein
MLNAKSINVIHLLLIGPYLTYIGMNGRKCSPNCFKILTVVGVVVMLFHAYKLFVGMDRDVTINKVGSAVSNTISNVSGEIIGKDNNGNNVVVDEGGNVTVVDESGNNVAQNNAQAAESANQAMNNSMNNAL